MPANGLPNMVTGMRMRGDLGLASTRSVALALVRGAASGHRKSLALAVTFVGCGALGGLFGEGAGLANRATRDAGGEAPAVKHAIRLSPVQAQAVPSGGETTLVKRPPLDIQSRFVKTTAINLGEPEGTEPAVSPTEPAARPTGTPSEARAARTDVAPLQRDVAAEVIEGPWSVQLASERSESQALAVFEQIRNEHQAILGGLRPQVTKAELGAKGIYYRVRIGARSQEAANKLCSSLQAAGGSCWVQRN
jgi:cell division septation protein DedD